ncbi:DUF4352 domain-containing protein [Clostridium prolinivorans]|uniref:DUF4352 domain-containing protein n=1 Tax=Clostridium prolinivorans TaxID=2769420 RepID=UPI00196B710F|nr:DUF4352 domain-containing protein [Clostridium prolinivorans]
MSNLINCKACGKEIAKGVKKCPHCGKDQRNFFMKHKIITGILVLVVIGIIGSLGSNGGGNSSATNDTSKPATSSSAKQADTKKEEPKEFYAVNEDVKLNDAVVKVTKVEKSNGSDYDKPKDGMEFIIVTVSIKNDGKNEISYNPFDFKMQNSKGQITDQAFTTVNTSTQLNSGNLAAGGEVTGTIAFEQPKNDSALVLKYKGNMFSNKEIKIKLN